PSEGWGVRAKRGQTGDPSEGWGLSRAKRAKKRQRPPGSRVRKTLLPLFIELLPEADNPKFDQISAVNGFGCV
ncbi:MAG: hypothetical protein B1H11_11760, partial [Desulfobacteraceae bacterium 4484_190.1]